MNEVAACNASTKAGIEGRGGIGNDVARRCLNERTKFVATRTALLPLAS